MTPDPEYITQDDSELNIIFIHSKLDEVGLTPPQFRIYAHLSRRAHSKGKAWPGVDSMAKVCRMHKETVIDCIRQLEERNMILCDRKPGKSTIYRLTAPSKWVVGNGERSEMGNGAVGNGERHLSEMGNERKSIEGSKRKESKTSPSASPESSPSILSKEAQAREIYAAYPRKVGPRKAIECIKRALQSVPFEELLRLVKLYAEAREGQPHKFTPHPATWFGQGRYHDNQEEWTNARKPKREVAPELIF